MLRNVIDKSKIKATESVMLLNCFLKFRMISHSSLIKIVLGEKWKSKTGDYSYVRKARQRWREKCNLVIVSRPRCLRSPCFSGENPKLWFFFSLHKLKKKLIRWFTNSFWYYQIFNDKIKTKKSSERFWIQLLRFSSLGYAFSEIR